VLDGSPGVADPAPVRDVVLNEILAHTDLADTNYPGYDSNDGIELYNSTAAAIDLTDGWYLSDDAAELKKWRIPAPNAIAGYGWVWSATR